MINCSHLIHRFGQSSRDLGNLVEIVVYYLLIKSMAYIGYQDWFRMVSALVYMVKH